MSRIHNKHVYVIEESENKSNMITMPNEKAIGLKLSSNKIYKVIKHNRSMPLGKGKGLQTTKFKQGHKDRGLQQLN